LYLFLYFFLDFCFFVFYKLESNWLNTETILKLRRDDSATERVTPGTAKHPSTGRKQKGKTISLPPFGLEDQNDGSFSSLEPGLQLVSNLFRKMFEEIWGAMTINNVVLPPLSHSHTHKKTFLLKQKIENKKNQEAKKNLGVVDVVTVVVVVVGTVVVVVVTVVV